MRFSYIACLVLSCGTLASLALSRQQQQQYEASANGNVETAAQQRAKYRYPGASIISFDTVGKNIEIGLDYLVPFLEVPVKRKRNAPQGPLIIINTAAILSCSLVATGGLLVGHLIRKLGLEAVDEPQTIKGNTDSAEQFAKPARVDSSSKEVYDDFLNIFDNFKLSYRNASGARVETALPSVYAIIESAFNLHDINLAACLQKSICSTVYRASENVRNDRATDIEHLIDGATSWSWLMSWLQQSAIRDAIEAGKSTAAYCDMKYQMCQWSAPEQQFWQLFSNNVQFK